MLEQLAVLAEVALRWRDVAARLDADGAQRVLGRALRDPAVRRGPRDDDVVALADLERAEHRLDPRPAALDVDALVADAVAVPRARGAGDGVRQAHVTVAEQQPAAGDDVGVLDDLRGEQVVRLQVPRQQRVVGGRAEVADAPLAVLRDGRGDVAVVEQAGVAAEALLAHELLVVELADLAAPGGSPVLGVPLRGDAAHRLVVRHCCCPPRRGRGRGRPRRASEQGMPPDGPVGIPARPTVRVRVAIAVVGACRRRPPVRAGAPRRLARMPTTTRCCPHPATRGVPPGRRRGRASRHAGTARLVRRLRRPAARPGRLGGRPRARARRAGCRRRRRRRRPASRGRARRPPGADPATLISAGSTRCATTRRVRVVGAELGWYDGWSTTCRRLPLAVEMPRGPDGDRAVAEVRTAHREGLAVVAEVPHRPHRRRGPGPTRPSSPPSCGSSRPRCRSSSPAGCTTPCAAPTRSPACPRRTTACSTSCSPRRPRSRAPATDEVAALLAVRDASALADLVAAWPDDTAARVRAAFTAYGCCTVTDPLGELADLGLLPAP